MTKFDFLKVPLNSVVYYSRFKIIIKSKFDFLLYTEQFFNLARQL